MQILEFSHDSGRRVAYVSTYPPRECGIATFTKDLIDAIDEFDEFNSSVIAVNETDGFYNYDRRVKCSIDRDSVEDYALAAEYVNSSPIELVNLQHEFGLFGGECGENIKVFLDRVEKPVVTTLHTVHPNFSEKALEVLKSVAAKSSAIIVIARAAISILNNQGIRCENCAVIPHGCPHIEFFPDNKAVKESLGLKNRFVISTFGLLSNGKGIEYAIGALPSIIEKEPSVLYLIIGETHPEVRKNEGEKYRNKLTHLVTELGLEEHVKFNNRYLPKLELIRYLQATDVYLTPYISPNQISSGTLTYALGAGKAVVSTPYLHAQETLVGDRGVFCKFQDQASIAEGVNKLLDAHLRSDIQKSAYRYSRQFLWRNVAGNYIKLFKTVIKNNRRIPIVASTC
jgi:glycosyltransferase involved in cell wall biosynthesis